MKNVPMLCFALALSLAVAAGPVMAAPALTDEQKAAVEETVRELLTKKEPEIIAKAAEAYQTRAEKDRATKGQEAVKKNFDQIAKDPNDPVAGNPKGDVTVVEFFDYGCTYCKMVRESVSKLIAEDKNVRLVFKEMPIFGPSSVLVSKAALASVKQGKYLDFHMALMQSKDRLKEEGVMKIAKEVGLDVEKLKKDMEDPKIETMLKNNHELAQKLHIQGTPAFVIGDKLFPGAVPYETMKSTIEELREKAKK